MHASKLIWQLLLIASLSACSEKMKPTDQVSDNLSTDPLSPRYEASLAEGIDFAKPGYPSFLAGISGLSGLDKFGRWTDGASAKIHFKNPLPNKFKLFLSFGSTGSNIGKAAIVRAGAIQRKLIVASSSGKAYVLNFEDVNDIDTLEIIPPAPIRPIDLDPTSTDTRSLGLALIYLKVQN